MTLSQMIRNFRNEHNVSMQVFAEKSGLSKGYISMLENEKNPGNGKPISPSMSALDGIARAMRISLRELCAQLDGTSVSESFPEPNPTESTVVFPVIGEVAAGYDHPAAETWTGETVELPVSALRGRPQSDYFVLTVCGDSMYPLYLDGDKVLIRRQSSLSRSGEIGVFRYDDDKASLKKVEFTPGEDWIRMVPVNPSYTPLTLSGEELEHCSVLGVPVLLIREIDG